MLRVFLSSSKKNAMDGIIIHIIHHFNSSLVKVRQRKYTQQIKTRLVCGAYSGIVEDCDAVSLGV